MSKLPLARTLERGGFVPLLIFIIFIYRIFILKLLVTFYNIRVVWEINNWRKFMKHKSIIGIISTLFFAGICFSIISFFDRVLVNPEIVFLFAFIVLTITCILFFHSADSLEQSGKSKKLTTVINKDLYICRNTKARKLNRLFIKVSMLFM